MGVPRWARFALPTRAQRQEPVVLEQRMSTPAPDSLASNTPQLTRCRAEVLLCNRTDTNWNTLSHMPITGIASLRTWHQCSRLSWSDPLRVLLCLAPTPAGALITQFSCQEASAASFILVPLPTPASLRNFSLDIPSWSSTAPLPNRMVVGITDFPSSHPEDANRGLW
jgi:hypothetical protein